MRYRFFFLFLFSFLLYAETRNVKTHIENPSYGNSSRFQVIQNDDTAEQKKEQEDLVQQEYSVQNKTQKEEAHKRVFDSQKINESKSQSVQEFLESKGFLVMTSGGAGSASQLSYKGYTSFCIKVYVDGILANNSTAGEFDWNSIDINTIEKIEIEDTPALSDTEFAGCIVRITTKNFQDKLIIDTGVSSYQKNLFDTWYAKAFYAKSFEKFKFNLGTSLLSAENEFEKPSNLGTNLDNFSRQGNAHFGWNVRLSDNTSLSGKNSFNYNNLKTYNSGSSLNNGIETDISTFNNVKFSYQSLTVKSDTDFLFNFANVEYINSRLTSNIDNTGFFKTGISENIKWLCDFTAAINFEWLSYNPFSNRMTANLGAGKKFQIGKFSIEPQLATLIWFNQNFGIRLLPRLTMSFEGLSLSFFRECTLPTFNQLYWPKTSYASGNPTLNSEDGWSAFLGFKRDDFPLWAQYKFSYYGNKICWTSQNGKLIPANSADGIYNVVTLGIEQNFFDSILKVSLDATYTSARLCSTFKQIMWVPEWQAHAGICINVWRIIFNADYSFTGRRWASNENVFFYPEFHLLDITLTARCTDSVQAYLKVNNLLDQKIAWHDSYYIPSRKFTIGIKIEK